MIYPKEVFNIREDVTRARMKEYDKKQEAIAKRCLEIDENYYHLGLKERRAIRLKVEEEFK